MGGTRRILACVQSTSRARHCPDSGSSAERVLQNRRVRPGHARISRLRLHRAPQAPSRTGSSGREAGGGERHREMKINRLVSVAAFTLITAMPLGAQAPKEWLLRADRSTSAESPLTRGG